MYCTYINNQSTICVRQKASFKRVTRVKKRKNKDDNIQK